MSTLRDTDKCTDTILDFIAGGVPGNPMGESKGNYNAKIGRINATDDLSQYTLDQIYEMQAAFIRPNPPDSGGRPKPWPSTAIMRYQFLKKTLQGLAAARKLPGSTKVTPHLQDVFGVDLLNRRGYADWRKGVINDDEFLHRLSCEWASLPDPKNGGKSHYDGDAAGNHASTTLAACRAMLAEARSALIGAAVQLPPVTEGADLGELAFLDEDQDRILDPLEGAKGVQLILRRMGLYTVDDVGRELDIDGLLGRYSQEGLDDLRASTRQRRIG